MQESNFLDYFFIESEKYLFWFAYVFDVFTIIFIRPLKRYTHLCSHDTRQNHASGCLKWCGDLDLIGTTEVKAMLVLLNFGPFQKPLILFFFGKGFIIKAIARSTWETDGLRSRIVWTCYGTTHGRRQAGRFVILLKSGGPVGWSSNDPWAPALFSTGGFLKWWYPTTIGFPLKNDHFGVWNGGKTHHLRKHPTG